MKKLLILVFLLGMCSPAYAGKLGISWGWIDHPPPPYSYILLRDGAVWSSFTGLEDPDSNDPTRSRMLITNLPPGGDCTTSMFQLRAVNNAGASDLSESRSSLARPSGPGGVGSIDVVLNSEGVYQILGDYFPLDVLVFVNSVPIAAEEVNRLSCQLIEISTTSGTPILVAVINPLLPNSPSTWMQPPPFAPTDVEFD